MRNEQTNLSYATPLVEIIEVEVEQGFAQSNTEGFGGWQQ